MAQYVTLSPGRHQGLFIDTARRFQPLQALTTAPVLLSELPQLLAEYLLAFRRHQQQFELIAVLGIDRNCYLNSQYQWLAGYLPAVIRGFPFKLARRDQQQSVLCIRDDALSATDGEPLFDKQGGLSEPIHQLMTLLAKNDQQQQHCQQAVASLQDADLIRPWPLTLPARGRAAPVRVEGLYRIDAAALKQLPANTLASLRQNGALDMAYGQLLSAGNISAVQHRILRDQPTPSGTAAMAFADDWLADNDDKLQFS